MTLVPNFNFSSILFIFIYVDSGEEIEIDEFKGGNGICCGSRSSREGTTQELVGSKGILRGG